MIWSHARDLFWTSSLNGDIHKPSISASPLPMISKPDINPNAARHFGNPIDVTCEA